MAIETMHKVSLKPLGNKVLAKRVEHQESSKGGILLPDSAKKKQETAKVVAVGPGKLNKNGDLVPIEVKVGDTILMDKYSGQEVTINDHEYIILKSDDIIAIIES